MWRFISKKTDVSRYPFNPNKESAPDPIHLSLTLSVGYLSLKPNSNLQANKIQFLVIFPLSRQLEKSNYSNTLFRPPRKPTSHLEFENLISHSFSVFKRARYILILVLKVIQATHTLTPKKIVMWKIPKFTILIT